MLSIDFIKSNLSKVRDNIKNRRFDPKKADIDRLLELSAGRNQLLQQVEELKRKRNEISDKLKDPAQRNPELIEQGKKLKDEISILEEKIKPVEDSYQKIMAWIPNMALDDVPVGLTEEEDIEIKAWIPGAGYLKDSEIGGVNDSAKLQPGYGSNANGKFKPKPHWEIGTKLGMIDIESAVKVSGSRFYYLKGDGWLMMYAVFDLLMKHLLEEKFTPMYVPVLVRDQVLFGSSHFPADEEQVYKIAADNVEDQNELYLIGSSEPSLFGYFTDKTISEKDLPVKVAAISSCFRSEAGSWGKDVRGIKRVHQFEKLEMDMIIENDLGKALETHEYLLSLNEWLLQKLEIPYHVINMCTGDLGYAAAAKKYDIEVWLPSTGEYMEVMSNSITTDFQSRRLGIRVQKADGKKEFAYTLNDTGATHRLLPAILDHYQQEDGSVKIPEVLREYFGGKEFITTEN